MAFTPKARVWSPDGSEKASFRSLMATMASSIENGLGLRVGKLETFVGCNLSVPSPVAGTATITKVSGYAVLSSAAAPGSFNNGMTVNSGTVIVPEDGIYNVQFTANFLSSNGTQGRVNSYIYVNNVQQNYSSSEGATSINKYTNCSVSAVYTLKKNDQIDVRIATQDGGNSLQHQQGSSFCVSLVSRALT